MTSWAGAFGPLPFFGTNMRKFLICLALLALGWPLAALAQTVADVAAANRDKIVKPSRQTIGPVIDALVASGDLATPALLAAWADKRLGLRASDGLFFILDDNGEVWGLTSLAGAAAGDAPKGDIVVLKPNSGVRSLIATALVQFQLTDPAQVESALASVARDPDGANLAPLRAAIAATSDGTLKARMVRLERLLTVGFDEDPKARVAAIEGFGADLGVDVRAVLNPLVATTRVAGLAAPEGNVARRLSVGKDISPVEAYDMLVAAGMAPARLTREDQRAALLANTADGASGGVPVAELNSEDARNRAYTALEVAGTVPFAATDDEVAAAVVAHQFYDVYNESNAQVTVAAAAALTRVDRAVGVMQAADLALDALSLASIYFLAAIGLAITFGVMRVINMAHGEFIMMGAYVGYLVQQVIPNPTLSIVISLPLAFLVTFLAGVALERLVIRHLARRPLETLLATFGISIALQQLAKNIFGTQARPLTAPGWLDGAWVLNDVVSISYIRIAIFGLALIFLAFFLVVMTRTRLGLQVRAVTQNPAMAASMGINPDRINMLTFGLGSAIAGVAGVAIGLFAKVTSELGSDYIVQSFMTVVVGGVGSIFGMLAGAAMIGGLQKVIEFLNPSNTLAAQTYMVLFIILFIQFRPRGIIALHGRAAGD